MCGSPEGGAPEAQSAVAWGGAGKIYLTNPEPRGNLAPHPPSPMRRNHAPRARGGCEMEAWGKGGGPDSQAGSEESQDSRVQVTETPGGDDFEVL